MMGFVIPGDEKVAVPSRDWFAMKLAVWRMQHALQIAEREAMVIVASCKHEPGCPGKEIETEPCFAGCEHRETRMSALVIQNAARQFLPVKAARKPEDPYYTPSREYFSEVLSTLGAAQIENEVLRRMLRETGVEPPTPEALTP
jgi:hypothetical protein